MLLDELKKQSFVTIVVLNYNGANFLTPCLSALISSNYPRDLFEIVVVDNESTDGSVDLIRKMFPSVDVIEAGGNIGFSRGNNLAMRRASGPFVALVNPDTVVDPNWLNPLVGRLQADATLGAVASKLILDIPRVPVTISSEVFCPAGLSVNEDNRSLGVRLYEVQGSAKVEYRSGVGPIEMDREGKLFRWTHGDAELAIPLHAELDHVFLRISAPRPNKDVVSYRVLVDGNTAASGQLGNKAELCEFEVRSGMTRELIQNAGSELLPDGSSRDRGTRRFGDNHFYDWIGDRYNVNCGVFAFCGAGVLLRLSTMHRIGMFDERIFMYYEDTDLSVRMRRNGWGIEYEPSSVIRHHHAGLSKEWSPGFTYNVTRSRIYIIWKHWPRKAGVNAALHFVRDLGRSGATTLRQLMRNPLRMPLERAMLVARMKVILNLPVDIISAEIYRRKRQRLTFTEAISRWIVDR